MLCQRRGRDRCAGVAEPVGARRLDDLLGLGADLSELLDRSIRCTTSRRREDGRVNLTNHDEGVKQLIPRSRRFSAKKVFLILH